MPSKFTRRDLKNGKAKVSVLSWMAGLDPVVPAKKKSRKRPKGGWFPSRTKTTQPDKYYDADESSSGDDSDASIVVVKKDGHKSILKNGVNRSKFNPVRSKKVTAAGKQHKIVLDTTSDESEDSSSTYDSETSSASEATPPAQPTTATGGKEESSSESIPAATTTEGETTDTETSAMSDGTPAAPAPTPVSGPTIETEDVTGGLPGTFLDMMTTGDDGTQTEPVTTRDEAVQATSAAQEAPTEPTAPTPTQPAAPATEEPPPAPADPNWTPSQDAILTAMKQGGESWKAIATALGKSKKDIVARWKLLVKNKNANSTSTAGPSAPPPVPVPSPPALAINTAEVPPLASPTNALPPSVPSSKRSKHSIGKGEAPLPSSPTRTSGVSVDEAMDVRQSHEEEMRAMLEHLYSAYSDQYSSRLRPDAAFSELDCRVLSLLDAKIRAEKWLSLQAAFYNVTGRMVPVALLREKMGDAEEDGE